MSTGSASYTPGSYVPPQAQTWNERCCDEMSRAVEQNPSGTLLTAFGAGLGIGLAIGLSLALSTSRPKPRGRAEEIGHRILESIHDLVPESISRRMG